MLTPPEIQLINSVLAFYTLGEPQVLEYHAGTAAKTWRIETESGKWLLRTRGSRTSNEQAIAYDHALRAHLLEAGLPTAAPVRNRNGQTFTRIDEQAFEIYPLLPGSTSDRANRQEIESAAQILARFHQAGATFHPGSEPPPVAQYQTLGLDEKRKRMEAPDLLARLYSDFTAKLEDDQHVEAKRICLRWLNRLVTDFDDQIYQSLPQTLTHGDFTLANLLFDFNGDVCGVFDFDWSRRAARVRDLADGMFFIAGQRQTPLVAADIWSLTEAAELDTERCLSWLNAYQEITPLRDREICALPLAFAARWLSVRIEGRAKVPPEQQQEFTFANLAAPLAWFDRNWLKITKQLLPE